MELINCDEATLDKALQMVTDDMTENQQEEIRSLMGMPDVAYATSYSVMCSDWCTADILPTGEAGIGGFCIHDEENKQCEVWLLTNNKIRSRTRWMMRRCGAMFKEVVKRLGPGWTIYQHIPMHMGREVEYAARFGFKRESMRTINGCDVYLMTYRT